MAVLRNYEQVSRQMVNLEKSLVYLHDKVLIAFCNKIRRTTRIRQGNFSFTYLGCPIFHGRENKGHYEKMVKKVMRRLHSWQDRLLAFGGRYILIDHVLFSMPVYILSIINPPVSVINQLHKIFSIFFWRNGLGLKNINWISWDSMFILKRKGELSFRSLHNM